MVHFGACLSASACSVNKYVATISLGWCFVKVAEWYIFHILSQDNMLQHKQEERKLKRIEGDIVKKQRLLRRVMHDYDNGMY